MKIKEKIEEAIGHPYKLKETQEMVYNGVEQIVDTTAIEFARWCNQHTDNDWRYGKFKNMSLEEIYLDFKKEKGL